METKNLITVVAMGAVLFLLGGALGVMFSQQGGALPGGAGQNSSALSVLGSDVVPNIVAVGNVSNVSGKNLTLTKGSASITMSVPDSTQIYSYKITDNKTAPVQEKIDLSKIKTGDNVNARIKVLPSGQFEASALTVFPVAK